MKAQLEALAIQLLSVISPLIVALVGALLAYAIKYIQSKTKNQNIQEALDRLDDVAMGAVKEIQQSVVSKLDPSANPDEVFKAAKQAAVDSIKAHYGVKGLSELQKVLGWEDMEKNLASKVEEKVHDLKLETTKINVSVNGKKE